MCGKSERIGIHVVEILVLFILECYLLNALRKISWPTHFLLKEEALRTFFTLR